MPQQTHTGDRSHALGLSVAFLSEDKALNLMKKSKRIMYLPKVGGSDLYLILVCPALILRIGPTIE